MKDNFIHVCFIIDESGSMYGSESDIIGGFKKTINEQKENENGECAVSLYKFADKVTKVYLGKDVNEVDGLDYTPQGCTAMNDAIGTAITEVGKWLNDMDEADRPSKNLIIIMTDGEENSSCEYTLDKVREMIKHQEEKYNWTFVYMGIDITTTDAAKDLGVSTMIYNTRDTTVNNYSYVSSLASTWRNVDAEYADTTFNAENTKYAKSMNTAYMSATGINLDL